MSPILSIASAVPFLALIGWIALKRRFLIYLLLFILIAFAWRLASSIYIDTGGPVYSEQLFRAIGGGTSSFVLVAAQALTLLAVLLVFSPDRLRRLAAMRVEAGPSLLSVSNGTLRGLVFGGVLLFLILLFADMARGGVIPLFAGIEEYVYNQHCAGRFHGLLIRFGDILLFVLGLFHWNPLLMDKKPDRRFLLLFVGILVYMLLASHRFSAFYRYTMFFLMPLAVVVLRKEFGGPPQALEADAGRPHGRAYLPDVAVVAAAAIAMVLFGTYRSLFFPITSECAIVRSPEPASSTGPASPAGGASSTGPASPAGRASSAGATSSVQVIATSSHRGGALGYLRQRVLVTQGELWWVTYERIFLKSEFEPVRAFTRVFIAPITHPRRNSTVPYLMERAIGDRAYDVLRTGSQYAGGFPEIFFEMFGKVMAFPAIFLMSLITARLLLMLVESALLQRAVRSFLIFYVLYAFLIMPISGMLNFLVNWKFWLKVAALVGWLFLERRGVAAPVIRRVPVPSTPGADSAS